MYEKSFVKISQIKNYYISLDILILIHPALIVRFSYSEIRRQESSTHMYVLRNIKLSMT